MNIVTKKFKPHKIAFLTTYENYSKERLVERVKELDRLISRKDLEIEILKDAFVDAYSKLQILRGETKI